MVWIDFQMKLCLNAKESKYSYKKGKQYVGNKIKAIVIEKLLLYYYPFLPFFPFLFTSSKIVPILPLWLDPLPPEP